MSNFIEQWFNRINKNKVENKKLKNNTKPCPVKSSQKISIFLMQPDYEYLNYNDVWVVYWNEDKPKQNLNETKEQNSKLAKMLK